MLGVFSSSIVSPPDELVAAGSRTPSPKVTADKLVGRFLEANSAAVSLKIADDVQLAYTHQKESPLRPSGKAMVVQELESAAPGFLSLMPLIE